MYHAANESHLAINKASMRQKILANGSGDLIVNHQIRKHVLSVNKADPTNERQNASQPTRWLETAADKTKLTR